MRDEWVAWLEPVRTLALEASARILEIYDTAFGVTAKEDNSPLTAADLAAIAGIVATARGWNAARTQDEIDRLTHSLQQINRVAL